MGRAVLKILIKILNYVVGLICFQVICLGIMVITKLHRIIPVFPILFFFDMWILVGYPIFLYFIPQKRLHEYTQKLKYLLIPYAAMILALVFYYDNEALVVLRQIAES